MILVSVAVEDLNNIGIPSLKELNNTTAGMVITLSVVSVKDQGNVVKSSQVMVCSPGELNEDDLVRLESRLKEKLACLGLAEGEVGGSIGQRGVLSPRQREALELARDGLLNKEIAEHMGIGEQTVKNMLAQILHKLEARNRVHAVIQAIRKQEIELGREGCLTA